MLASSSHMAGSGQLRSYFQHLRKRLAGECSIKALVNVIQRHAVGQAFKYQRDGKAGATDSERAAQQKWISHDPEIIFVLPRFKALHAISPPANIADFPDWLQYMQMDPLFLNRKAAEDS